MQFLAFSIRADHHGPDWGVIEANDLDDAARQAIAQCPEHSFVAAVIQADTTGEISAYIAKVLP